MNRPHGAAKIDLPSLRIPPSSLRDRVDRLVAEMEQKTITNERINLSVPTHIETTLALHRLVYAPGDQNRLRIEYNDGSLGKPFSLHSLWQPATGWGPWPPRDKPHLFIGSLSLRHVDYDRFVDMYLIRDKQTRHLNQGAIDALAYSEMLTLLNSPELEGEYYITILQAGLEPLAVGMYRAIVEHLQKRNEMQFGVMCIGSIFRLREGKVPSPQIIWGAGRKMT